MSKDYYAILGVPRDADEKTIKKAYRTLSKEHHPDKGGDEEKFKEIAEAYSVLGDANKKAEYDNPPQPQFGGGFADFFNQMRRQQNQRPTVTPHVSVTLNITLEECFNGVEKEIEYTRMVICGDCNGQGGTEPTTCPECGGRGSTQARMGNTIIEIHCGTCNGTGQIHANECHTCGSSGYVRKTSRAIVDVQKSLLTGSVLVSSMGGNEFRKGQFGDLRVQIAIDKHPTFNFESLSKPFNLVQELELTYPEMVLGCEKHVPNIEGKKLKITVPPLTQNGALLRLKGQGLYHRSHTDVKSNRGDMLVEIWVTMPTEVTDDEREVLHQLQDKMEESLAKG